MAIDKKQLSETDIRSPLKSSSTTLLKPPFHIFFFSRMMIQTSI